MAQYRPTIEPLEDRRLTALIASQLPLATLPQLALTTAQVDLLLKRAAAATGSIAA